MPTTYSDLVPVRRVAVGDCFGPLGSGFDALARSAYASLLAASWAESAEAPLLPVHDNGQTANRTIPHGDAWKCTYGYDAAARTERSACGAVCYTFALPADATASGNVANISAVSLSIVGDRYLDRGVDLYLIPSASSEPPTVSELLALTPAGTYCATASQNVPPNQRHGVTAAVTAELGVAAQPYLHAALLLHDYVTNRGAWIEGGAILDGPALSIVFSRDVAADMPASVRILRMTDILKDSGGTSHDAVVRLQLATGYHYFAAGAGAESDVNQIIRLTVSGIVQAEDSYSEFWDQSYDNEFYVRFNSANNGNPTSFLGQFPMFYAPPRGIQPGLSIPVPFVSSAAETDFVAALVQVSSAPAHTYGPSDIPVSTFAPLVQVLDGGGDDVIAIATGHIGASGSASASTTVALPIVRRPTKPYLALVAIPYADESGVKYDNSPVLVASASSNS